MSFTDILIIGGSYGGASSLKLVTDLIKEQNLETKIKITLIEPKQGFLNLIATPCTLVNLDFAKTQYYNFTDIKGFGIHKVVDGDGKSHIYESDQNSNLEIIHIQGKVTNLSENEGSYKLNNLDEITKLNFLSVILASGRDRNYPITPIGRTKNEFLDEMKLFYDKISNENIKTISIIGGGAVGIEFAGEIKHYLKDKNVNLIHPYKSFPPEDNLSQEFKDLTYKSLVDAGINVIITRISKELNNGNLITIQGETIESDFNYWSTSKKNNVNILDQSLNSFILPNSCLKVNNHLQLSDGERTLTNFYCVGDIVDINVLKTAGWAIFMAGIASKNVVKTIFKQDSYEKLPPSEEMKSGMLLVAGNGDIVGSHGGTVEINNPIHVDFYKDYRFKSIFEFLKLTLPSD